MFRQVEVRWREKEYITPIQVQITSVTIGHRVALVIRWRFKPKTTTTQSFVVEKRKEEKEKIIIEKRVMMMLHS